jgi:DNA polymerase I-like protein with 3'-5' exonuclease and polymerase domains
MSNFIEKINNKIIQNNKKATWSGSSSLECAKYYGKPLQSATLDISNSKLKSFIKAYSSTGMDKEQYDFADFIPDGFLEKYANIYSQACEDIINNHTKPANYVFLKELDELLDTISQQKLNVLQEYDLKVNINRQKCFKQSSPYVKYNLFGTVTGRLTTQKNSFPILTMNKDCRFLLSPTNELFMELDYNACELRVLLALSEHEQPSADLHVWNQEHVFENKYDRKECKIKIFSWLYDNKVNELASKYYDKQKVKDKYWKDGKVTNFYGREIECDEEHALNYIVQSTASDMFLRQVLKVNKLLEGRKSKIAFMIHDSLIIDLAKEDRQLIGDIEKTFSETDFGAFKTNISAGKTFGEMRIIK